MEFRHLSKSIKYSSNIKQTEMSNLFFLVRLDNISDAPEILFVLFIISESDIFLTL